MELGKASQDQFMEYDSRRVGWSCEIAWDWARWLVRRGPAEQRGNQRNQGNIAFAGRKMSKTTYIFVNGIMTNPESVDSWTDRAEQWIDTNTSDKATKMEYRSGVLTRRLYQNERVRNLQTVAKRYLGQKIVLVAHSNGGDIVQRLIAKGMPKISEIHLIASASEADFKKNGFNRALRHGNLEKITVYVSPVDNALKKARWSTRLFGWMGLGYGYLGLVGPKNVEDSIKDKVKVISDLLDHSQWFSKKYFDRTMQTIIGK